MKIALLGYGTVGRSLHDLLEKRDLGIEVKKILRRKRRFSQRKIKKKKLLRQKRNQNLQKKNR